MPPMTSYSLTPWGISLQPMRKLIGIAAEHHRDRHRLLARLVLVAHLPALLAGRDVEAAGIRVVDHHAVGAAIDPAVVGIADDGVAAGADIAAAVLGVPLRRREFGDVDLVAGHDVLHHRTALDVCRRDALHVGGVVDAEAFAQLDLGHVGREAERHVLALAVEEVEQHAAARQRAGHVLEHEARRVVGVRRHLGHHADVLLPGQPFDVLHLAELLGFLEPVAQVVIGEMRRGVGADAGTSRCPLPRRCRPSRAGSTCRPADRLASPRGSPKTLIGFNAFERGHDAASCRQRHYKRRGLSRCHAGSARNRSRGKRRARDGTAGTSRPVDTPRIAYNTK